MKRYLIETEQYVASCEFDTQEHFDRFLKSCQQKCQKTNAFINERIECGDFPDWEARYAFEYRDNLNKTDADLKREDLVESGVVSYRLIWTKIYPESVLENDPAILLDKQAKWNNRHKYYAMDKNGIDHMQQYLDRAKQIRKNIEAKNTAAETSEQPPSIADYPHMIQVPTGVGVPDTIESYQENIEDTDGRPANVNVVNQLTIDDLAEGFAKGLLKADALSQKSREAKIRDMQEDMLSQQGHSPVDIARIHNPSAGKSKIRTESLRIGNTQRSKKNN